MYRREDIDRMLYLYDELGSVKAACVAFGGSHSGSGKTLSHSTLEKFIRQREAGCLPEVKPPRKPVKPNLPKEIKLLALHRIFVEGEPLRDVAKELSVRKSQIYNWKEKLIGNSKEELMPKEPTNRPEKKPPAATNKPEKKPSPAAKSKPVNSKEKTLKQMQDQMFRMQMEIDILNETLNIIKKDPGVDPSVMKNSEKAVVVDAMRGKYPLPLLLETVGLARSSYYYHKANQDVVGKYSELKIRIQTLFEENNARYGYRRIKIKLQREGCRVSEKVIRRLMKELRLVAKGRKRKRYKSYAGEIGLAPPNLLQRDFHAEAPNKKWLTDVTEFSIPAGKVYLSPIIDCLDGLVVGWKLGTSPNAQLAIESLEQAIENAGGGSAILHSDRGWHYRYPKWIEVTETNDITRSMSKKGCSPDNSACEGFFGRLKNECFYGVDFKGYTTQEFMDYIDEYIRWYNNHRVKVSLDGMSPIEYRKHLGYVA